MEIELIIDHAYIMKPLKKFESTQFRELWAEEHIYEQERVIYPNFIGTDVPNLRTLPEPPLSIWLFAGVLSPILYNKLINKSKRFPDFYQ
jgi:hypothetical protein